MPAYFRGGRRSLLGWASHHLVISTACTFSLSGPIMKCTRHSRRIRPHAKRNASSFVAHVPIQSLIKIVRCPTHASTIAGSVPDAEGRRPDSARPVQRGDRHEDQQAPRVVEQQPDGGEGRGHLASGLPIVVASTPYDRAMSARGSPASRRLRAS